MWDSNSGLLVFNPGFPIPLPVINSGMYMLFRWPRSRDFHRALGPPGVWRPALQSDPTSDSPGITTATRTRSRGSVGLARVEAIAGPGQSAGATEQGSSTGCRLKLAAAFIVSGHGGPRGGAVGATFPETSRLPLRNEGFGISGWRLCPGREGWSCLASPRDLGISKLK